MTNDEKVLSVAKNQKERLERIASGYDASLKAAKTPSEKEEVNMKYGTINVHLEDLNALIQQTKHDIAEGNKSETSRQNLDRLLAAIEKPAPETQASFADVPTTLRRYY